MSSIFENKVLRAAALYGAITLVAGGAYAFGDRHGLRPWWAFEQNEFTSGTLQRIMDQTEQNTLAITKQEFTLIEERKDRTAAQCEKAKTEGRPDLCQELSWEEKRDYCINAKILRFPVTGCLEDGSGPDLTTTK